MQHWRLATATLGAAVWLCATGWVSAQEAPRDPPSSAEIEFWQSVKDSKDPAEVRAYLDKHPNGEFATLARLRLQALENSAKQKQPANAQAPKPATPPALNLDPAALKALSRGLELVQMTPEVVREVQQKLYDLNYSISKVDGVMSDETVLAIRRLQAAFNQSATGKLTGVELAALRLAKVPTVWGALAWESKAQNSVVFQRPDRATAERDAKALCKKKAGRECTVVAIQTNRCVALAAAEGRIGNIIYSATGVGQGANLEKAREFAQIECRGISKTPGLCKVRQEVCADGSHRPQPAVVASPSQQPGTGAAQNPPAQSETGQNPSAGAKSPVSPPKKTSNTSNQVRPDALGYSYKLWPDMYWMIGSTATADTRYGKLHCTSVGGGRRVCSWQ